MKPRLAATRLGLGGVAVDLDVPTGADGFLNHGFFAAEGDVMVWSKVCAV